MRFESFPFTWGAAPSTTDQPASAAPATSNPADIRGYMHQTVQANGAFTGSYDVEVTLDGNAWSKLITGVTDTSVRALVTSTGAPLAIYEARIVFTGLTVGTPKIIFAGRNARSDGA